MDDMIIKGSGNSRFLRSVPNAMTLYPTYESFLDALVAGTFPIDLNGINPSGVEQAGTRLNKANLLTDSLCTALGLATTATPTQAMEKLKQLAEQGTKFELVSYVGTNTYGASNPTSITFSFAPKIVLFCFAIIIDQGQFHNAMVTYFNNASSNLIISRDVLTSSYTEYCGFSADQKYTSFGKISSDGKTWNWYTTYTSSSETIQLNSSRFRYYFMGLA